MNDSTSIPTTEQITAKAAELGRLISRHAATVQYREVMQSLQNDMEAQRILTDYNRKVQSIVEKEQKGVPVEVEDKQKLRDLQSAMAMNPILSKIQIVQMDYLDLMRKVESTMTEAAGQKDAATADHASIPTGA